MNEIRIFKDRISRREKGFSFFELIAVIAIMGILMMVGLPRAEAYFRSIAVSESRHNYQTIVYSIREWSLGHQDNTMVPDNFTVQNTQGKSVIDYLREYNREFYDENIRALVEPNLPASPIYEISSSNAMYGLREGILTVDVLLAPGETMEYNALPSLSVLDRTKYVQK